MVKIIRYIESIVVVVVVGSSYATPKNVRRGSVKGCIRSASHINVGLEYCECSYQLSISSPCPILVHITVINVHGWSGRKNLREVPAYSILPIV